MIELERQRRRSQTVQWLLIALIAVIVVTPFLVIRAVFNQSIEAEKRVSHTALVEATAMALAYETRNLEAATLALANGINSQIIRDRISQSRDAIPDLLSKLETVTVDNPVQQRRVGMLRARIEQRLKLANDVTGTADAELKRRASQELITRATVNDIVRDMVSQERTQLAQRATQAQRTRAQAVAVGIVCMALQLALLAWLVMLLHGQQQRRLQAEREERRSSGRAEAVLQTLRDPIALLDEEQRVVMHNHAFADFYAGSENGSINGTRLEEIANGAWHRPDLQQRLHDVGARGRELWDFEHRQQTNDGAERITLLNAQRLPSEHGHQFTLLTVSDVTALKASEVHVQELNHQLQGKIEQISDVNRELEAFSYSVSHDLRAPLRHIAGFTDKLKRHLGAAADEKSLRYIDVIQQADKRMAALIDDLLVYSRLGRSALRLQPVDMQSLVDEARAMLESTRAEGQQLRWQVDPLPIVIADENMMRQVWSNLLGNAVKYSRGAEVSQIRVSHQRLPDGGHEFSVSDNGAGFDMAYAHKLFGVFQRLHNTTEFEGTGIGLASVKRVLLRHGGDVSAESQPGQGATFRFTLPALLDNAATLKDVRTP